MIAALLLAVDTLEAQVMPPDSANERNNSERARELGLHTSGATTDNKPTPKEDPQLLDPKAIPYDINKDPKKYPGRRQKAAGKDSVQATKPN